jgi:periplasmic divalent cation tolerance protein
MTGVYVILVTAPSIEVARELSHALVAERLAACVNILPGLISIYRWEGAIEEETELLMVVKSAADRFEEVKARVQELHPYDEPEVVGLDVVDGSHSYLKWVLDESGA